MAATATFLPTTDKAPRVPGSRRRALVTLTLDNSYATGGYALPSTLGFTSVDAVLAGNTSAGKPVFWTGSKLKVFSAIGTEVTATTDLSAETVVAEIVGI